MTELLNDVIAFDSCPDVLPQGMFMLHLHGRTRSKRNSPLRRSCPSALSRHPRRGRFLRLEPEDAIRNVWNARLSFLSRGT